MDQEPISYKKRIFITVCKNCGAKRITETGKLKLKEANVQCFVCKKNRIIYYRSTGQLEDCYGPFHDMKKARSVLKELTDKQVKKHNELYSEEQK